VADAEEHHEDEVGIEAASQEAVSQEEDSRREVGEDLYQEGEEVIVVVEEVDFREVVQEVEDGVDSEAAVVRSFCGIGISWRMELQETDDPMAYGIMLTEIKEGASYGSVVKYMLEKSGYRLRKFNALS